MLVHFEPNSTQERDEPGVNFFSDQALTQLPIEMQQEKQDNFLQVLLDRAGPESGGSASALFGQNASAFFDEVARSFVAKIGARLICSHVEFVLASSIFGHVNALKVLSKVRRKC